MTNSDLEGKPSPWRMSTTTFYSLVTKVVNLVMLWNGLYSLQYLTNGFTDNPMEFTEVIQPGKMLVLTLHFWGMWFQSEGFEGEPNSE